MLVELLSVGIDGWCTHLDSWKWVQMRWKHLDIWLVFVVAEHFPEPTIFKLGKNGIRYGWFRLADVVTAEEPSSIKLLELVQAVNDGKAEVIYNMNLQELSEEIDGTRKPKQILRVRTLRAYSSRRGGGLKGGGASGPEGGEGGRAYRVELAFA